VAQGKSCAGAAALVFQTINFFRSSARDRAIASTHGEASLFKQKATALSRKQ
jgi:hypothetical protein